MDWYEDTVNDVALLTFIAVVGVAGLIATIFFLLNLRDLLRQVRPQYQAMKPNLVWLNLIPLFSYVWMIITVIKVRDSVKAEFQSRGWAPKGDFGFGVGLAYAILSIFAGILTFIPLLVCWIMYWMKTAGLKRQMETSQPPAGWAPLPTPPSYGGSTTRGYGGATSPGGYSSSTGTLSGVAGQTCASCGAQSEPGDVFCRSCGEHLDAESDYDDLGVEEAEEKDCPYCGAANRENAQYCNSCGRTIG